MAARPAALLLALLALAPVAAQPALAQESPPPAGELIDPGYLLIRDLLADDRGVRRKAAAGLVERGDPGLVFGIVDALFFIARPFRGEAFETLEKLTGQQPGRSYWDWVEAAGRLEGRLENVRPSPGYPHWKATLFAQLDPGYRQLLDPRATSLLRLEEVVSGGVRIEGIPTLDDPAMVAAGEAGYLEDDEEVFGVAWSGEARAYPRRFLDWHEMLNDRVAGEPISFSYCTLCGSGVLYKTARPGAEPLRFATSGLLYRSNKLMFDRETKTLWNNLTGVPVHGPLAGTGLELPQLAATRSTWADWRRRHPDTLVVALDKRLRELGFAHGFDYRPGKADQARRGVSFPVWKKSPALPAKEEVYALRLGGEARAYVAAKLFAAGLLNDRLGGQPILLLADRSSGAVRAYRRPPAELRRGSRPDLLEDAAGRTYQAGELALSEDGGGGGARGESWQRLPGHFAFFFGWYAFFPQTTVWPGPEEEAKPDRSGAGGL
jgi:hypothetical protein